MAKNSAITRLQSRGTQNIKMKILKWTHMNVKGQRRNIYRRQVNRGRGRERGMWLTESVCSLNERDCFL